MENYFDDLKEQVKYAKNNYALDEIKKIAKRRLLNIISNQNIKNSVKSSSKKQYKFLLKKLKQSKRKFKEDYY
jgi:hypothetical protein